MFSHSCSFDFLMVFLWFSVGFTLVFLWFSLGSTLLLFGFPVVFQWFPLVFCCFSCGFPLVSLWFPLVFRCVSFVLFLYINVEFSSLQIYFSRKKTILNIMSGTGTSIGDQYYPWQIHMKLPTVVAKIWGVY